MNILVGSIMHESNTFSPIHTDINFFKRTQYLEGKAIIDYHLTKSSEMGGIIQTFKKNKIHIIPTLSAVAITSGIVTRETYAELKNKLIDSIKFHIAHIDGVLLTLHGAMTVEGFEDPEGDLLKDIRLMIPSTTYLSATLDHHANVSELMIKNTDFLIGYRTHPHIDQFEIGCKAAELMMTLINEKPVLTKSFIKLPLITPGENRSQPIVKMHREIKKIENMPKVFTCSYFVGYPWADVNRLGASVLVITHNEQSLASKYAEKLANMMWKMRKDFQFEIYSIQDAVRIGNTVKGKPIVLDELCDCTYGGSSGDVVSSIRFLIESGIQKSVIIGVVDPDSVKKAVESGIGSTVRLEIGGKVCKIDNPPLYFEGIVKAIDENIVGDEKALSGYETLVGKVVVVEKDTIEIVLIEYPGKIGGPSFLLELGVDPREKKFIITKEGLNPLVSYKSIAKKIFMVESPGFNKQILDAKDYRKVNRPIYPLDPDMEWSVETR